MMALLCVTAAWAETVTMAYTGTTTSNMTGNNDATLVGLDASMWSVVGSKGGNSNFPGLNKDGDIRLYWDADGGNTLEVSSLSGAIINSIAITYTGDNYSNAYVKVGDNTIAGSDGVYEIEGSSFVIGNNNTSNLQVRIKSIVITYTPSSTISVATPVISFLPSAPYQGDETTCTITCATEGASIQYSTDGETYQNYSEPFTLTETTTVYAKATLGDDVSAVAEKTVTFTPITTVANIAALTQLTDGTVFRMARDWTATVVYVYNNYVYIKDDSGSTLLYDVTQDGTAAGQTISNLQGKVSIYNGLFEVSKPATYTVETIPLVAVNPVVMAVENITIANVNQYVKLEGVTLSTINNNNFTINGTLSGRHRFSNTGLGGVDYPDDPTGKTYNVIGFVGLNNNAPQFWPTAFEDVTPAAAVEKPVIEFDKENPVEGETVNCTITCVTEGATIMYALGEGDFQAYSAAFPLTETTTVKAKAVLGQDESSVATATITFSAPPVELDGMIVFADREGGDNSAVLTDNTFMAVVEKGADYVQGASNIEKVYAGATGLKFSSSSANGSMTLNLKNKWNATKISFIAKAWINSQGTADVAKLTVNNQEFDLTSDFALYEIPFETAQEIQNITFAATKRAYLKVINIEGQEIAPSNYTITLDNAPGNYTSNIVVKATVSELPEGAKLYYTFLPTGSTATAQEKEYKAGVKLFQSGTLTFILRDADNAELATAGGEYTVPPFGDINGDGKTDVSDVNELVNVILGKFSMDVNN